MAQAEGIYNILTEVLDVAEKEGVPTPVASNKYAEERINTKRKLNKTYVGQKNLGEISQRTRRD